MMFRNIEKVLRNRLVTVSNISPNRLVDLGAVQIDHIKRHIGPQFGDFSLKRYKFFDFSYEYLKLQN